MILKLLTLISLTLASTIQHHYAQKDADALAAVCAAPLAADVADTELLCRYRLYPLTEALHYLEDMPETIADGTARELALLSGLWGYRAARSGMGGLVRYGRRAVRLMDQAKALDPSDPYVLLIDGQSLLFRPALFGGDAAAALASFEALRIHPETEEAGIASQEVDLWIWYTHHRQQTPQAATLRAQLLSTDLPPLYREFVHNPPA